MDATCNVQGSIHVFHLVHNMCPGFWVHITWLWGFFILSLTVKKKRDWLVGMAHMVKKVNILPN